MKLAGVFAITSLAAAAPAPEAGVPVNHYLHQKAPSFMKRQDGTCGYSATVDTSSGPETCCEW
jgi:hypothetical protein